MDIPRSSSVLVPRLNPFAFPSDTTFRFVLLVISILAASIFTYDWLYLTFNGPYKLNVVAQCTAEAKAAYPTDPSAQIVATSRCTTPADRVEAMWSIGGIMLLLSMTGLIYWVFPYWKLWRARLIPLSVEDAPELIAYLKNLCSEVGLSQPPTFVINTFNTTSSGVAFGRFGRYYVALTGGLVMKFYTDLPAFRAVVLHELAHLRNADVDKTYFAVAISWAFVVAAFIPLSMSIFFSSDPWNNLFMFGWRSIVLAAFVYLILLSVLRARELYADVRAAIWDGPTGALSRVLGALPAAKRGRWRTVWQSHPAPIERQQVLGDPQRLFQMDVWNAFGTGVAATIAYPNVVSLLSLILSEEQQSLPGLPNGGVAQLGAALVFAPLIVGVVGLGVLRTTFVALARAEVPPSAGRLGVAVALGCIVGQTLSFSLQLRRPWDGLELLIFTGFWYVVIMASLFLFFRWVEAGAAVWLPIAMHSRSLRLAFVAGLVITGGALATWLGQVFLLQEVSGSFLEGLGLINALPLVFILMAYTLGQPLLLLMLISLWAFPLTAWFWRRRMTGQVEVTWAFLDTSTYHLPLPRQAPIRPGLAFTIGVAGGLLFVGIEIVLRVVLRLGVPEFTQANTDQISAFNDELLLHAWLLQGITVAVVAGCIKHLREWHGLFAAFVAGCVMTGGFLVLIALLTGGSISFADAQVFFGPVVGGGALLALVVAFVVSTLTLVVHRSTSSKVQRDVLKS